MTETPAATDLVEVMLRDVVGPAPRDRGLRGSGRRWRIPDPAAFAVLEFQSSRFSRGSWALFTMNLAVVRRDDWERERARDATLPPLPSAGPRRQLDGWWQHRIGDLLEPGFDRWWELFGPGDVGKLAADVLAVIDAAALPAMRARLDGLPEPPRVPWPPIVHWFETAEAT